MILRPYQSDVVDRVRLAHKQGHRRVLVVMPTGAGKTVTFADIARRIDAGGGSVLIIVPRVELVRQTIAKLDALGVRHGVIAASERQTDRMARVQVAMAQTIVRRVHALVRAPDYIIVDECHLAAANTWTQILARYPDARTLGVTATLERLDGKGFEGLGSELVNGPSVSAMIDSGNLCAFRTYTLPVIDASTLRTRMGEFDQAQQAALMERAKIVGDVVDHWQRHADGRSTIVFAASVTHSKALVDRFCDAGIAAEHLDGTIDQEERAAILARLASGATTVVCNFGVLTEGFDCPRVSCVQIVRCTASRTLFRQMAGRGLRPLDGKTDCVILDHGGNALRHGNLDYDVPYQIAAKEKTAKSVVAVSKACKVCAAVMPASASVCAVCGSPFATTPRPEIREQAGNLVELQRGYRPTPRASFDVLAHAKDYALQWSERRRGSR